MNRCAGCDKRLPPGWMLEDGWMCEECIEAGKCARCCGAPRPHREGCVWPGDTLPHCIAPKDREQIEQRLKELTNGKETRTAA